MSAQVQRFSVTLHLPGRELAQNARCHWAVKSRVTRSGRIGAMVAFRKARPLDWPGDVPVSLEIRYHCPRGCRGYAPHDKQNAIGALKAAIDGMVDARVVPDDSDAWVSWGDFNITRSGDDAPGVYVTVVAQAAARATGEVQEQQGEHGDERIEAVG